MITKTEAAAFRRLTANIRCHLKWAQVEYLADGVGTETSLQLAEYDLDELVATVRKARIAREQAVVSKEVEFNDLFTTEDRALMQSFAHMSVGKAG
jgi:hypothetical protein